MNSTIDTTRVTDMRGMVDPLEAVACQAQELRPLLEVTQEHIMEGDSLTLGNLVSIAQRLSVTIVGDAEALIGVCRKAGKGGANHE
ncbi:MAG: hypothetical protein R3E93_05780 [Thiothrix sp.]